MELAKVIFFIDAKSEGNLKFLNLIYESHDFFLD